MQVWHRGIPNPFDSKEPHHDPRHDHRRIPDRRQVSQILVQPLEAASVVLAAGPRIFDSSEPLRIPTLTGSTP